VPAGGTPPDLPEPAPLPPVVLSFTGVIPAAPPANPVEPPAAPPASPPVAQPDGPSPASVMQVLGEKQHPTRELLPEMPLPQQIAAVLTLLFVPDRPEEADGAPILLPSSRASSTSTITGVVFDDLNGDGMWQEGEPTLEGMRVYLDVVGSGEFAENKPWTVSDENGQFHFDGLAPRSYRVQVVPHRLYAVTAPEIGFHEVQLQPETTASVTFGCKPQRPRATSDPDASAKPVGPAPDALHEARDALFMSGGAWQPAEEREETSPWWGGLLLASFAVGGTRPLRRLGNSEFAKQQAADGTD